MRVLTLLFFLAHFSLSAQPSSPAPSANTSTPATPKAIDARIEELASLSSTASRSQRVFSDPSEFITDGVGELRIADGVPIYLRVSYTKGETQQVQEEAWFDGGVPIYYRTIEKVWDDTDAQSGRVGQVPPVSENRMTVYLHGGQIIFATVDEMPKGGATNRVVLPTPYSAEGVEYELDKWVRFQQSEKELQGFE